MENPFLYSFMRLSLDKLYPFESDQDKSQHEKYIADFLTLVIRLSKIYYLDFHGTQREIEPKIYCTVSSISKELKWNESKVKRVLTYCKKMKWLKIERSGIHGNKIIISKDIISLFD